MWFGTSNLGIYRFDGQHVDWMYEDHLTNPPDGGSFGIRSIIEDRNGDFWLGTLASEPSVGMPSQAR